VSALLEQYERQAVILGGSPIEDLLELSRREAAQWKPRLAEMLARGELMALGGGYYQDTRPPFNQALYPSVTLATTSKMLVPTNPNTAIQPSEWTAGKKYVVTMWGQATTAATPGNLTVEVRLATTDAGGTLLATSAAVALTASKTNITWVLIAKLQCFNTGSGGTSGSLIATGVFLPDNAGLLIPAANNPMLLPASAPAAVTADLSAASGLSVQWKRSGSTAETAQVVTMDFEALN